MTSADAYEPAPGLIGRVKALIMDPPAAWDAIAREDANGRSPFGAHAAPLAALMAIASWVGGVIAAGFKLDTETLIVQPAAALIHLILALFGVAMFAKLADALARRFGATPDPARAMQLSAYGATGILLGGLGAIVAPIAPYLVAIGGVFSMVLVYIGLPRTMGAPEEKRIGYFWSLVGVVLVATLVLSFAYGPAITAVRGATHGFKFGEAQAPAPVETPAPILAPGEALDAAALKRLGEESAAGAGAPFDPARLEGFLPPSLPGGFARESAATSAVIGASQAEATYTNGQARLVVTLTHLGQRGALYAIDQSFAALTTRQDASGYGRHQMADGRLTAERQDGQAINYTIVGRTLAVSIAGSGGATMDDARAAVETIPMQRLEDAFPR